MNIAQDYIDFIQKKYKKILTIRLGKNYVAKTTTLFLRDYINVRYYENIDLRKDDLKETILERFDDLKSLLSRSKTNNCLENIIPCFDIIFYIDNVDREININNCLENLEKEEKQEILEIIKEVELKRNKYFSLAEDSKFKLEEQTIGIMKKINITSLSYDIKFSKLYSDYAIEKAYNSGIINEDKLYVEYAMVAMKILIAKFNNENIPHYIIEFNTSLLSKNKKLLKLLNIIDNPLIKQHLSIKITYSDYLKYMDGIRELIRKNHYICLIMDNEFICDKPHLEQLVLFNKILIDMKYKCYDYIVKNKKEIKSDVFDVTLII